MIARLARTLPALLLYALLVPATVAQPLKAVTVVRGLDHPWSIAFLPDFERSGRALVTERVGRLRIVTMDGTAGPPLQGVPRVEARGQGGLLDIALDPDFAANRLVYLSYVEPGEGDERGRSGIAVARGRLEDTRLADVEVLWRARPKVTGTANFGSRLVFGRDGRLFVTVGDRFGHRDAAQDLGSPLGKVLRLQRDGSVPPDNPFVGRAGALPEIWSYGHRNPQGAALHPGTGQLWTHEHGPQGGDELNVDEAGRNYGWPVITYGRNYGSGTRIGEGTQKAGMEQPLVHWAPSVAPSGMAFLTGERYPGWRGNLFIGTLRAQRLIRLELDGRRVVHQEALLPRLNERIRDVREGPDGWLYLLTDSADGQVIRLVR